MVRSIALGGGGTRGGLHVGALRAVEEHKGDLVFPDGIYGASVGAFLATAIAFGLKLPAIQVMYDKYFLLSNFMPTPGVNALLTLEKRKGFFSMDKLMNTIVKMFEEQGVSLRGKRCCDALQPLYIVASNMTTGQPTLLTGRVPVLDALRCSAAIPLVFEPQMLYGDVYLDAGVHLRCLGTVVPKETIVIHISGGVKKITPASSLSEILFSCYSGRASQYFGPNVCRMRGVNFAILGELSQADREYLAREGYLQTRAFLSKLASKELLKSGSGDSLGVPMNSCMSL
jgi:hypothetical protein